jgi:hypothetical protein
MEQEALMREIEYYLHPRTGTVYRLLGESHGAGTCRGERSTVYQDAVSGQLYHRAPLDFAERMTPLDSPAAERALPSLLDAQLLADLDDGLEDLELHGLHSNPGYRKLKQLHARLLRQARAQETR